MNSQQANNQAIRPASDETTGFVPVKDTSERKDAVQVFETRLLDFLSGESPELMEVLEDYNRVLMLLIGQTPIFKKSLEDALYKNQELLTEKRIVLGEDEVDSTVANWLADFIAKKGSDYFDNVALSDYLTASANAKKLTSDERRLLSKLLSLYRNLKFFPQSLANVPFEQWEIIPLERRPLRTKLPSEESGGLRKMSELEKQALAESQK